MLYLNKLHILYWVINLKKILKEKETLKKGIYIVLSISLFMFSCLTLGKIDNKSPEERSAEEAKLAFKANAVRNSINSDEKFKNLMELLFPEERYRLAYERRYEQNQDVSGFEKWDTTSFSNLYRGMDWRMKQTNQQGMKQSERQDVKNNDQLEL